MSSQITNKHSLSTREDIIISAAVELIYKNEVHNLTMDKVVDNVTYSKGTVYKYFEGKEDLLMAISNKAMRTLHVYFLRSAKFEGNARIKILLLNMSYLIFSILHPSLFISMLCANGPNIYSKSSEKRKQEQEQLRLEVFAIIYGIIEHAINDKMLVLPKHMNIQQVCFANWSIGYNTISLLSEYCSSESKELSIEREIINQNNLLCDGLNWRPLSGNTNNDLLIANALQQVFPKELALIKSMGRGLNLVT